MRVTDKSVGLETMWGNTPTQTAKENDKENLLLEKAIQGLIQKTERVQHLRLDRKYFAFPSLP